MGLTITVKKVETAPGGWRRETTERIPLTVPKEWSCFTSVGNRGITRKAQTCLSKVEKMVENGTATRANVRRALVTFLAGWRRMWECKSYYNDGISDTAVRECVGSFHDQVWDAVFGYGGCDEWDENYEESWRRVEKSSN